MLVLLLHRHSVLIADFEDIQNLNLFKFQIIAAKSNNVEMFW